MTFLLLASLLALELATVSAGGTRIPVTKALKDQILAVHNMDREKQKAKDMSELHWNDTLAEKAFNWTQRCQFKHESKGFGENLAFDTNPKPNEVLLNSSMQAWYDEIKIWGGHSCAPRSCHYTQMVWAKTTQVGCAIVRCPTLFSPWGSSYKKAWYLGCWYDPKGNDVSELPFHRGSPCTGCATGQTCDASGKFCEGEAACEDNHKNCATWKGMGECSKNPNYMNKNCHKSCGCK